MDHHHTTKQNFQKDKGSSSWDDLKKAGSNLAANFTDWCKSFIPSTSSGNSVNNQCFNCHKIGTMPIKLSKVQFCSQACHTAAFQEYQNKLSNMKCKLQGCHKQCFIENNGMVHQFCSKSHAQEYQKQEQQQQHFYMLRQQHSAYERKCKFPSCTKSCYKEHGKIYDFCGKQHAEMFKQMYMQRNQSHYASHGQQQRGNTVYYQPQPQWPQGGIIHFYNRDEPYYEFTNFAPYPVMIDNMHWPTTEHYFQAQKFVGTPYEEAIRHLSFPREAFDFSRKPEVSYWRRSDWEQVKDDIMHKALLAKFKQHEELQRLLLSTEDCELVEHTRNDSYWGDGGDGSGKNHLGKLLMKVRQTLRSPPKCVALPSPPQPIMHKQISYEQMPSNSPPSSPPPQPIMHKQISYEQMPSNSPPSPLLSPSPRSSYSDNEKHHESEDLIDMDTSDDASSSLRPVKETMMKFEDNAVDNILCMTNQSTNTTVRNHVEGNTTSTATVITNQSALSATTSTPVVRSTSTAMDSTSPGFTTTTTIAAAPTAAKPQLVGVPNPLTTSASTTYSQAVVGTNKMDRNADFPTGNKGIQ